MPGACQRLLVGLQTGRPAQDAPPAPWRGQAEPLEMALQGQAFYVDVTKYAGDLIIAVWSASQLQLLETKAPHDEKTL